MWSDHTLAINGVVADMAGETLLTQSGLSVRLRPQAFAVLRYLAEHAGRLVTKHELMQAVWPGIAVTNDSLVQCIHEIRRALQDDKRTVLKTASKRGYRLMLPAGASSGTVRDWPGGDQAADVAKANSPDVTSRRDSPLAKPAKVAIAVLPFANISPDRQQEYFSEGITADIITDLSRWRSLAVASRNSTSRYKGQSFDMKAVGRELGVNFLVEGTVRRMGARIRITAELIDASTGNHVWAERFDRPVADLFAVQDEVVRTIAGTVVGRVYVSTAEHLRRTPPSSLAAYDLTMRANWLSWNDPTTRAEAKRCFAEAIDLDPGYGLPHSLLALMRRGDWHRDLSEPRQTLDEAFALAMRGVELAENDCNAHGALSLNYLDRRAFAQALRQMELAVHANPANAAGLAGLATILVHIGRAEEGLEHLQNARRIDPYFGPFWYWVELGLARFVLHRYEDALADFDRGAAHSAETLAVMTGCCAKLGLADRIEELMRRVAARPAVSIDKVVERLVFANDRDSEHLAACLRLAGLPETGAPSLVSQS